MKVLLNLFWVFFRIGAVTFGGGYAMLPILERELCEQRGWVTKDEIMDYYAIAQCTPGIIAVNTSVMVGYKIRRVGGGIAAMMGIVMPSLIIITIISAFIKNFAELQIVQNALGGIRVAVCALVMNSIIKMFKTGVVDLFCGGIFIASLCAVAFLDVSPILVVVGAAVLGIAGKWLMERIGKKKKEAKDV